MVSDPFAASYATLRHGTVARTVAVTDDMNVDVDADDLVLGVEVIGNEDWQAAFVNLAMSGRLAIPRRKSTDA